MLSVSVLVEVGLLILYPRIILLEPVVRFFHTSAPIKTLLEPVERLHQA